MQVGDDLGQMEWRECQNGSGDGKSVVGRDLIELPSFSNTHMVSKFLFNMYIT